ncbi:MAG: GDP-mannose 4,6-dehydratase [Anaerolineales bacterium]|nr:GDP-mannose 4,6-dehydratase [Anaerolineales bacterium]MCS7248816.1 GDP-mannose 4,6-dehydratase [Anaerolineales bacterium]MDW8162629.1 GDP-mannose 4,6-dehydratase [Anaerolineales bacterium]MDW8445868.1 GDP-mannose 4,6-dehydratase [Anaerolineales bacterium]
MSDYLITGVAGFIGAMVAERLLNDGHTVYGVDNLNDAYDVRLKDYRLRKLLAYPNFTFERMDIGEPEAVRALFAKMPANGWQAVINLAARAGVRQSLLDPWVYYQTNLTGTLNLLEACRQHGIKKFLLASTSSVYGADAPLPTPEDASSDHPLQPYAASKKAAEVLCHTYHYLYGLDITVVRYFTVYGPAGRPDMVMFRFVQGIMEGKPVTIYGDGTQSRGFTYVDDIAEGTILALQPLGYEILNLGGHETIRIVELLTLFEQLTGKRAQVIYAPAHPADMYANWADTRKAQARLGWQPKVGLQEGVKSLVEWYLRERAWASQVVT